MHKTMTLALTLSLLSAGALYADRGKKWDPEKAKARMEKKISKKIARMSEKLALSKDQEAKLEKIVRAKFEKRRGLMKKHHEAMKALHEQGGKDIEGILDDEQKAKFAEMKKKGKKAWKKKRKGAEHKRRGRRRGGHSWQ